MFKVDNIEVKIYNSVEDCLLAYFKSEGKDKIPAEGNWEYLDKDGKYTSITMPTALRRLKKRKCWAYIEDNTIHIGINKGCKDEEILRILSHEVGHTMRPFHRDLKEEQKADKYEYVGLTAFKLFKKIKERF